MVFDDVLDLAHRIDVAAAAERKAARDRHLAKYGPGPYKPDRRVSPDPDTPAWLEQWPPLPWPVELLIDNPTPPAPMWPDGAQWDWSDAMWRHAAGQGPISAPPVALLVAAEFLIALKWERVPPERLATEAVKRVSTITLLELDARVDDDLAGSSATTRTRARRATSSAETKRAAVAADVQMTLNRIPADWESVVFRTEKPAGTPGPKGKW